MLRMLTVECSVGVTILSQKVNYHLYYQEHKIVYIL
jgi:hypothetical protein